MDRFFRAESVAVVGVSNSSGNLGRAMVYNLMEFRYQGCIYLVGPKGGAFAGHKIYPNVLDIPEPVELATILVPAAAVPEVLSQCGEKGISRIVLQTAGFRELGSDRMALEDEVLRIIKRYGMRMIGPNCIGIINRRNGLAVPFMPFEAEAPLGKVAVISQSGGVGAMMINSLASENIGFSKFSSVGNKLNVNEADLVEYLSGDEDTEIIFTYLEGIADGRRLMDLACRSPKKIVAHKSNNGSSGAVVARSHSASLSSDNKVVDAAFKQCGIIRIQDQGEAVEAIKALSLPEMKGNRLAVISRSGGHAVMAADAAEEFGFELPPFPEELLRRVHEHSRAKVIQFHNPMDLGDLFDLSLYRALAEESLARDDIDGLLFIYNYQGVFDARESRGLVVKLGTVMEESCKPIAVCVFSTQTELVENRKLVRYPIFTDPREALRALATNRDSRRRKALPLAAERPPGLDPARVRTELDKVPPGAVPPETLASILAAYHVPLVPWEKVDTEEAAAAAARRLGFPVVLKTAQPEIVHKSDEGGVFLNLSDGASAAAAYGKLQRFGSAALVQKMSGAGLEWLIGGRQDHQFGPVVVAGLGGIYVEIFKETAIRIGPVSHEEAGRLLDESRGEALLRGVRGEQPLDRGALMDVLVHVSWLLHDFPEIAELDLNPVRVFHKGCLALDWRAQKGPKS